MALRTVSLGAGAKTTITVTLTSLAAGAARESTAISNTTTKFVDARVRVKTNGGGAGSTGMLDVYVYSALGDTTYSDDATGTNAAYTLANRKNSPYLGSIRLNLTTGVVGDLGGIAACFGGIMPDKWGLLFLNNISSGLLSGTAGDHVVEFEGVYGSVV